MRVCMYIHIYIYILCCNCGRHWNMAESACNVKHCTQNAGQRGTLRVGVPVLTVNGSITFLLSALVERKQKPSIQIYPDPEFPFGQTAPASCNFQTNGLVLTVWHILIVFCWRASQQPSAWDILRLTKWEKLACRNVVGWKAPILSRSLHFEPDLIERYRKWRPSASPGKGDREEQRAAPCYTMVHHKWAK